MKPSFPVTVVILLLITITLLSISSFEKGTTNNSNSWEVESIDLERELFSTNWEIDREHSNVMFSIIHLGIAEVQGCFTSFTCSMKSNDKDFSDAIIKFTIDVNSIDTNNEARDRHLKSNDFFNTAAFPQMIFESKSFKQKSGNNYKLNGKLTIRDITKSVTFNVVHKGSIRAYGIEKIAFQAEASVNRINYQLQWNQKIEDGTLVVGEDIKIILYLEFNKEI
jgi:polyisoprenoid-binding protein YceI